jgi:hypothetical protein
VRLNPSDLEAGGQMHNLTIKKISFYFTVVRWFGIWDSQEVGPLPAKIYCVVNKDGPGYYTSLK